MASKMQTHTHIVHSHSDLHKNAFTHIQTKTNIQSVTQSELAHAKSALEQVIIILLFQLNFSKATSRTQ